MRKIKLTQGKFALVDRCIMTVEQKLEEIKKIYPRGMITREYPLKSKKIEWKMFGFLDDKLLVIESTREKLINKVFNELKKPERNKKVRIARGLE